MYFRCPFCNQPTTITSPNKAAKFYEIDIDTEQLKGELPIGISYLAIVCPDPECKGLYFEVSLKEYDKDQYLNVYPRKLLNNWSLLPESSAKPQPTYIPKQLVQDYEEACKIKSLSPKASATLARRAIQGMIRDYWGIKKDSLQKEIDELEDLVSKEEWSAIDAVRSVGNIGAHMEKDVNVIVEIEPEEADLLIQLIEDFFAGWYVSRHEKLERQAKLKEMAKAKSVAKKAKPKSNA